MANAFSKELLSASTDGRGVAVAATTSAGTTIHTAHATAEDEIYIYATNISTSAVKLTLEWGGTTAIGDHIEVTIPAESGLELVVPGFILTNSLVLKAFAGTTNVINLFGFVNRVTVS